MSIMNSNIFGEIKLKKYVMFLVITCLMTLFICGSVSATNQTVIPSSADVNLSVSNDAGARFDAVGNESYNFFNSSSQSATQGQNALHLTPSNSSDPGNVKFTTVQSGTFYMSDTGGRGWDDNGILMVAINGTIPDTFWVRITASGYQWTPLMETDHPTPDNLTYVPVTINETFTKIDFLYGPQIWKPCPANNYPIYEGQDMSNSSNTFNILFVDLWAGIFGPNTRNLYPGVTFIDNGMIKITYELFNLPEGSLAAFGAYAYCQHSKQGEGIRWVNRVGSTGASGYYVYGVNNPPVADFSANPTSGTVPMTVQFTDHSTGTKPLTYSWDFNNDGIIDSTEQNPTYTYNTSGIYTVKLTVTNTAGNSTKSINITTSKQDIVAPTPSANVESGSFNTNKTINLTVTDDQDPHPKIYYTLNGGDPTESTTLYNGPINIDIEGVTVLKFRAVDATSNWSPVYTKTYTIDKTAPSASVNPTGGTYNTLQHITLNATDNLDVNTSIYFTVDGSDPETNGTLYTGSIILSNTTSLKFAAKDAAGNWGLINTENYTMVDIAPPVATVDLLSGSFNTDQVARLSTIDELDLHPKIYYTLNGTDPTTNSTLYDWPISINIVGTTILKVIAVDAADHISDIITRIYVLDKPGASGTWNSTTLDTNIMYNSVAVDASSNPHIAYYQKASSGSDYPDLKYAYLDETGWHIETLETTQSGSGFYVSLAMDSSGNPHIAYSQSTPDKLKYAYKDATGWYFSELATNTDVSYINLVLFNDKPQISYYENTEEKIKYMYYNGTNWFTENVTSTPTYGHWNSLALNYIGNPRISFYELSISTLTGVLKYAKRTPTGIWQITTVDDSGDVGQWNSLATDSQGNPCISYNVNGGALKYAYWANAQWNIETVDNLRSLASKLVLDQSDIPRIVYQDFLTGNLKYAYKEGLNWIITNIDTVDGAGHWISLILNPSGSPSVSYMSANSRLKYANLVPFNASANPIGGTYNINQTVNLTSTIGTTLYYTLDGSDPRISSTKVKYTAPIFLNDTIILKFAAVDSATNWGSIHSETYNILTPPTVTGLDPANGAVNVAIDKVITVTFNEAIKAGNLNIQLKTSSGTLIPTTKSINGNLLTIRPTTVLAEAKYLLLLYAGCVTDLASTPVAAKTTSFSVGTSPNIQTIDPANYAVNIASDKVITVTFNEAIKAGNLNIQLKTSNGTLMPTTKSISGNLLTITPTSALAEARYMLLIYAGSVTDLAGNLIAAKTSSFSVGTSPTVTTTDPANYAMNVPTNKVITVTFNEPIVGKYLSLIQLKTTNGLLIPITKSIASNVLTIIPTKPLAAGTRYLLMIYSWGVTDLVGNPNIAKSITFITA
jgi:PKD repeat protein